MIKKSISLLSSLHDSYLLNKDERFLSITSELSNSIIKIYSEEIKKNISPKVLSDMIKNMEGIDSVKDVVLQILNGQIKLEYTIKDKTLTPIGNTASLIAYDTNKSVNAKNFIVALYMSLYISPEVKLNIFGDNQFFKLADTVTPNDRTVAQDLLDFNKSLRGTSLSNLLEVKDGDAARTKIINNIKKINDGIVSKEVPEVLEVEKPAKTPEKTKTPSPATFTEADYENAFNAGLESAKRLFEPYGAKKPGIENINIKIDQKMEDVREELSRYIIRYKIVIKPINIEKFTNACYMVVALKAIKYSNDEAMEFYYKIMKDNFKNWNKLNSLSHLDPDSVVSIDSEKAGKIHRAISPIIVQNIINSIPEEYKQQYVEFVSDLKNGYLTDVFSFCQKYGGLIGDVDSAKLVQVDYVLGHLGENDINACVRLILQRIEAYNTFSQTAKNPEYVEPLKKWEDVREPTEEKTKETAKYKNNVPMQEWFNGETIKMAGAFLYKLNLFFNKISE